MQFERKLILLSRYNFQNSKNENTKICNQKYSKECFFIFFFSSSSDINNIFYKYTNACEFHD